MKKMTAYGPTKQSVICLHTKTLIAVFEYQPVLSTQIVKMKTKDISCQNLKPFSSL